MRGYRFEYGIHCVVYITISIVSAWYFNKPEFMELGGVAVIIFAMTRWKRDFDNFSLGGYNLKSLEEDVKNNVKEIAECCDSIRNSESLKEVEDSLNKIECILNEFDIERGSKSENSDNTKAIEIANAEHLLEFSVKHMSMTVQLIKSTDRRITVLLGALVNAATIGDTKKDIKSIFTSIELELVIAGTIFWACGSYIYNGWHDLLVFLVDLIAA